MKFLLQWNCLSRQEIDEFCPKIIQENVDINFIRKKPFLNWNGIRGYKFSWHKLFFIYMFDALILNPFVPIVCLL